MDRMATGINSLAVDGDENALFNAMNDLLENSEKAQSFALQAKGKTLKN